MTSKKQNKKISTMSMPEDKSLSTIHYLRQQFQTISDVAVVTGAPLSPIKGVHEDSWGEILSVYRTCHLELSLFLC